jgi:hypothetical protein
MSNPSQNLQSLLSEYLPDKSLNLQVNNSGSQISVVINRPIDHPDINYESIAESILIKLQSLNLTSVTSVKVYGRPNKTKQIEWQASYPLKASIDSSTKGTSSIVNLTQTSMARSKFQAYVEQFSHYSNVISAVALIGLLLLLTFSTFAGQKTQAIVWEYRIESIPDITFTESINLLGAEGWELASARRAQDSITDTFSYECIFKRIKK